MVAISLFVFTNFVEAKTPYKNHVLSFGTWEIVNSPTTTPLQGLSMLSATNGWIVGANPFTGFSSDSTILKWNGTSWDSTSSPSSNTLFSDIDMLSSTDGWLVGTCKIYHWDGNNWTQHSSPSCNYIESVDMVTTNDVWAVGYGAILHWNGNNWAVAYTPSNPWLTDIDMLSSTDGWAVGFSGTLYHWNGSSWTQIPSPTSNQLNAIKMISPTDGWAVGGSGTILHYNGSNWSLVTSPTTESLNDIDMVSSSDGWIVGNEILHWNGSNWSLSSNPTSQSLSAIDLVSSTEGWAIGWDGVILRLVKENNSILSEARADLGMPYNTNRGCSSPYNGCGGPFHGFYKGVCTDLVLDSYNAGISFNIQNNLHQDYLLHRERYRYASARNAEDMYRYFVHNQIFLLHSQSYQEGDIAFFDWDGNGIINHVLIISEVDSNYRPVKMIDASGVIPGINTTGIAFEHNWSNYYEQRVQGHARLGTMDSNKTKDTEPIQYFRVLVNTDAVDIRLFDSNGKSISEIYDENLVASNNEDFIPYIPGAAFTDNDTQKEIIVTQPLLNTSHYSLTIQGQADTPYTIYMETLEDTTITDSIEYVQSISANERQTINIELLQDGGQIKFNSQSPKTSPTFVLPDSLTLTGLIDTTIKTNFAFSKMGRDESSDKVSISVSDISTQYGITIPSSRLSITPNIFDLPTGTEKIISIEIDSSDLESGDYLGAITLMIENEPTLRIPFMVEIQNYEIYLPAIIRN